MLRRLAVISISLCTLAGVASAEEPSFLQKLNQDSQKLYEKTRAGVVRVYMPTPDWALNVMRQDFAMRRWDLQLEDPTRPRDPRSRTPAEKYLENTRPPVDSKQTPSDAQPFRMVPRGDGAFELVNAAGEDRAVVNMGPRSLGILLDNAGHVLLPYYIEPEAVGDAQLTVACGDGAMAAAKFVGSDKQTMLTVVKLQGERKDEPSALVGTKPAEGSIVMFLNVTGEYGRMTMWTDALQDSGVVYNIDGQLCGFLRQGQFLDAARCAPVAEQLIRNGKITRPTIGIYVREILAGEPMRRENAKLDGQPGMLVVKTTDNSPAHRAGLREGDIILSIGGQTVGDPPNFAAVMTTLAGDTPLKVLRGGETLDLSITLTPR